MVPGKTSKAQNMHRANQKYLGWQMHLNSECKFYHFYDCVLFKQWNSMLQQELSTATHTNEDRLGKGEDGK